MWEYLLMWGQPPRLSGRAKLDGSLIPIRGIHLQRDFIPMTKTPPTPVSTADQTLVLSSLEHDQLVGAKKHHIPRRHFNGPELAVIWSLRVYLLFMMAVVVYQIWTAAH
jgi:hypothetical protein